MCKKRAEIVSSPIRPAILRLYSSLAGRLRLRCILSTERDREPMVQTPQSGQRFQASILVGLTDFASMRSAPCHRLAEARSIA
jgi:hypothetical protein